MPTGRIRVGEISMHFSLSGPDDAPVVCLNHCFGADLEYWDRHLPAFEGFRVLRYDTRGHGRSDVPPGPYSLEMLAADVAGLQDALGIERVHFCGVSIGGQVAQTFALARPERMLSLILVNTACEYDDAQRRLWRERAAQVLETGIGPLYQPLMQRWFTAEAAKENGPGYRYMDQAIRRFSPQAFAAAAAAMCGLDTTARLPEISVPTLVIGTPNDPGVPRAITELMAAQIPDARLTWLEPAQHLASLEHPDRFNDLVSAFLAEQANR